jgi:hypothetical protein
VVILKYRMAMAYKVVNAIHNKVDIAKLEATWEKIY